MVSSNSPESRDVPNSDVEKVAVQRLSTTSTLQAPPDGGLRAWLQVLGSFLIFFNSWGLLYTFGAFQTYYEKTLLKSSSASTIAWVGTVEGCLLVLVGVITGPIFDLGYHNVLLLVGSFLVTLGIMMLSLCSSYYQIFLAQGLCIGLGSGILYVPSLALVASSFTKRRGLAIGCTTSGGAIGGIIYPIVFRKLQPRIGFAWTTRVMGFIVLGTFLAAIPLVYNPNITRKKKGRNLIDWSAFKEAPFVLFCTGAFVIFLGLFVPFFFIPTFAQQELYSSEDFSFYLLVIANAASVIGRIGPAFLPASIRSIYVHAGSALVGGILCLAWIGIHNVAGFIVFCILFGIVSGLLVTVAVTVVPTLCPDMTKLGTRMGMIWGIASISILIGSPVGGALIDTQTGSFTKTQIFAGVTMAVGAIPLGCVAFLTRPGRVK